MRVYALVTRAIVALLVVRALAAPISFRPQAGCHFRRCVFVARVCNWPPQRLERFSHSSKLLQLFRGKNRAVPDVAGLPRETRPLPASDPSLAPYLAPVAFGARAASRSTDHLRC
jgi:hypothetical protein